MYTAKLEVSSINASRRAEAERIAKEIESTLSTNVHVAEECSQSIATDYDEEDFYSGVLTQDLKARPIVFSPSAAPPAAVENEKKDAVVGGKVMNYAAVGLATEEKGMAEMTSKPAAPILGFIPDISEGVEKAAAAANEAPTKVSSREEKLIDLGDHEKDAPVNKGEGGAKKDKSQKDKNKATASSKLKLNSNPNPKAFKLNPAAKAITPLFTAHPPFPSLALMQQPMDATQAMPPNLAVNHPAGGPHMTGDLGPGAPHSAHMKEEFEVAITKASENLSVEDGQVRQHAHLVYLFGIDHITVDINGMDGQHKDYIIKNTIAGSCTDDVRGAIGDAGVSRTPPPVKKERALSFESKQERVSRLSTPLAKIETSYATLVLGKGIDECAECNAVEDEKLEVIVEGTKGVTKQLRLELEEKTQELAPLHQERTVIQKLLDTTQQMGIHLLKDGTARELEQPTWAEWELNSLEGAQGAKRKEFLECEPELASSKVRVERAEGDLEKLGQKMKTLAMRSAQLLVSSDE